MSEHWELVSSLKANNAIPVERWRSLRSGLSLTLAQVEGPVVSGYFCLATEAHDDDGLPHTLEHLIFLGSRQYPYKGVLDLLANRCLSSGTNAWTDTDHTCYTMTTAGSQGFLNLLPIYLDHILHPTLTEAGFITEVHHITGEGKDGGVVYCEMQGVENTDSSLVSRAMLRAMYPGHCGYKSVTGGVMSNLRESTTNEKVRAYHKQFYRPENLGLIITGQVEAVEVFRAIDSLEKGLREEAEQREPFLKPWEGEVPKLSLGVDLTVPYPSDEEDNGMVYVAWRGPSAVSSLYPMLATLLLMEYLTETAVSPLQAAFVEVESPLASRVSYSFIENRESTLYFIFEGVPLSKVGEVAPKLKSLLGEIAGGQQAWDSERLGTVLHRRVLEQVSQVENSPHDAVAFMAIGDLLYGRDTQDLKVRMNSIDEYKKMEDEPQEFWLGLIKQYLMEAPSVVVRGIPSIKLQEDSRKEEEGRIEAQRNRLGKEGLEKKGKELDKAMDQNEEEAPDEVLTSVPIPTTDSIKFHPVKTFTSSSVEQPSNFDLTKMPVFTQFNAVNSNFVYLYVVLDTGELAPHLRPLLSLFTELLLEAPLLRDGVLTPYEEVVAKLSADCLESKLSVGVDGAKFFPGKFSQAVVLYLQAEPSKYSAMVKWAGDLLYRTKLTEDRVRVVATKMENSLPEYRRQGSKVVGALSEAITMSRDSNSRLTNMVQQGATLRHTLKRLDCSPNEVLRDLEEVRAAVTQPGSMMVSISGSLEKLPSHPGALVPWNKFLPPHIPKQRKEVKVKEEREFTLPPPTHRILGLGSCESAFFSRSTPCLRDPEHADLAPLLVSLQYLTQLEGPMWRQIRGAGLAYGYSLYCNTLKGQLYLGLYRATHPVRAFKEAKGIVMELLKGGREAWEGSLLESAKSSLIFERIETEKTVGEVVGQSLVNYLKGTEHGYNKKMLELIDSVTLEDVMRVAKLYLPPLFESQQSRTSLVVAPSVVESVTKEFQELGEDLQILNSLDELTI